MIYVFSLTGEPAYIRPVVMIRTPRVYLLLLTGFFVLTAGCAGPASAHRAAMLHTGYAYAFITQKADRLVDKNYTRAQKKYGHALNHYTKAYEAGLKQLEKRYPGFEEQLVSSAGEAVARCGVEDLDLLYWTAASLGSAIGHSKMDPALLIRLPQVGAMATRITEIDSRYSGGAAWELLFAYESSRPSMTGGSAKLAKHYFEKALAIGGGKSAGLFVSYAENISVQEQDKEQFREMLNRALAVTHRSTTNKLARKRAKWLLAKIDDLFL